LRSALALLRWPDGRFNRVATGALIAGFRITPHHGRSRSPFCSGSRAKCRFPGSNGYWARVFSGITETDGFRGHRASQRSGALVVRCLAMDAADGRYLLAGLKTLPARSYRGRRCRRARPFSAAAPVALPMRLPSIFPGAGAARHGQPFLVFRHRLRLSPPPRWRVPDDAQNHRLIVPGESSTGLDSSDIGSSFGDRQPYDRRNRGHGAGVFKPG